jgi:predicted GIY-YIG superfamily endonuclease
MTYYVYAMGPENSSTVKIGFTNNLKDTIENHSNKSSRKDCCSPLYRV